MHHQARLKGRRGAAAIAFAAAFLLFPSGGRAAEPSPRIAGELDAAGFRDLLARQKGSVVLVNFWATWCVPCREEFPDLVRLQRELAPRGFKVVGVSTDFGSQRGAVDQFLDEMKPGFPNYWKKGGNEQAFIESVDRDWGGELPFSVLYARDGTRVKSLSGKRRYADYRREVLAALSGRRER
ncbi:MAG: TlpA family protein disulfide reductase [Acidobacteria bacterium]|nr:TlpA family protein disulfide reductase [Acidobacteriota bacterium]